MSDTKTISLIGYASGVGAGDPGCGDGPIVLQNSSLSVSLKSKNLKVGWEKMLTPQMGDDPISVIAELNNRLAQITSQLVQQKKSFTVFGGDHSCAIGTWSGVYDAIATLGSLGLIWIDAHMDSHTPESSESGNIHGMPVASLLGYGPLQLTNILSTQPKIQPEHLCLIGIRSYEPSEEELIKRLGIRVYDMATIKQRGIAAVLHEAIEYVGAHTAGYGLSIDLDGFDPVDAPGVGTPVPDGISAVAFIQALKSHVRGDVRLLGMEITEFNPHRDIDQKTAVIIEQLLEAIFEPN